MAKKNKSVQANGFVWRRLGQWVNLIVFMLGILVIVAILNDFARMDFLRVRLDATKTRAYSLSPKTHNLLQEIQDEAGDWTIALLCTQDSIDPAVLRQIDELLKRYAEQAPGIQVQRIDPTRPRESGDAWDSLIKRLRSLYSGEVELYDHALDVGEQTYSELLHFAERHASLLQRIVPRLGSSADARTLQQRVGLFTLLSTQGTRVTEEVDKARAVGDDRLIPQYEIARSILAQALHQRANELSETGAMFRRWRQSPEIDAVVRQYASSSLAEYEGLAQSLLTASDTLVRLPELELTHIGDALSTGEAAVVVGPPGATVIPAEQLFPRINLRADQKGIVSFDRRFRGEQVISAAIRSLVMGEMPTVVFMHIEDGSLLRQTPQQQDVFAVAETLRASRYSVKEWRVGVEDKPVNDSDQKTIWVVIPPPPARVMQDITGGGSSKANSRNLIAAVDQLLKDGEPVLLSIYPSLLPRLGQKDPWPPLLLPFGIEADTAHIILEQVRVSEDETSIVRGQSITHFDQDHVIARALNGRQTYFGLPVGLARRKNTLGDMTIETVASIQPSPERWRELDFRRTQVDLATLNDQQHFSKALPVVLAVERDHPRDSRRQRMIVVGSGGWMIGNTTDAVVSQGGQRVALINPGNTELLMASVAWLAGLDDLIAPGPISQEIARIRDLSDETRTRWAWILLAALPGGCLLLGGVVWMYRRL